MANSLRVLIDARKLTDGGIGVYTSNLISGLLPHRDLELTLIGDEAKVARHSWSDHVRVIQDSAPLYSYDEMVRMPKRVGINDFDLFHCPHFTLPYGIRIPTVITVHDLIHVRFPEKSYYPLVASMLIRSAVKRATRVITVSESTHQDLTRTLHLPKRYLKKVNVVPNAIDPEFVGFRGSSDYVTSKTGVSGPYLLSVMSMVKPHKGLSDLLDAFCMLKKSGEAKDIKLVLAGKGTEELVEGESLLDRAAGIKGVHIMGSVSKEDLLQLYACAKAVVIPSLAEGFCLPVVEAQAVGTSVVARPVPAILELLGDDDVACESFSVDSLQQGIARALAKPPKAKPCADTVRARMRRFDRDQLGSLMRQIYFDATGFGAPRNTKLNSSGSQPRILHEFEPRAYAGNSRER